TTTALVRFNESRGGGGQDGVSIDTRDQTVEMLRDQVTALETKLVKASQRDYMGGEVERRLEAKNSQIEKLREQVDSLRLECREKESVMMKLMEELRRKSAKVEQLESTASQAASADAMLERKYMEVRALEQKVAAARAESKEKDGVIMKLVEELKKKNRMAEHAERLDEKVRRGEAEIESLQRDHAKFAQTESEVRYLHMKLHTSEQMAAKMVDEIRRECLISSWQ
ncbi:unnamed protein product, partial [Phaeothamnion confervicola]